MLTFSSDTTNFRQRIVLSLLSQKRVKLEISVKEAQISFLRLIEKITTSSLIEINHTGSAVTFSPGSITGGVISHSCHPSRALGYYLEPLTLLLPFAKTQSTLTLEGITNDNVDISVDLIRTVILPQLSKFGISDGIELKILKRGAPPLGGGKVELTIPIIKSLKPIQHLDGGLVKRIRGIAYCTRMSPQMANRMVESARGLLSRYIPDVYLYTDVYKGLESGLSPGYGLSLVAETTTGTLISSECVYQPRKSDNDEDSACEMLAEDYGFATPEDLGIRAARQLLVEIKKGGSVDGISQWLNLLFIALGPEDVGKIRISSLIPFTIQYLRDIKKFLGVTFKMAPCKETGTVVMTAVGIGFTNLNKKVA